MQVENPAESEPDDSAPSAPLLSLPSDGVPEPITTTSGLDAAIRALLAATGPVAVDAERASGYRYSQRAYLVQLRRDGAGTFLIDPIALPDLSGLSAALADTQWVLHAAHQDLPCLAEVGLKPNRLFDTELVGRLLGQDRVALGTMVEQHLNVRLEKGHSAADWSTRPLPHEWLVYAALDVELLIPLRDRLVAELDAAGKTEWAEQEFEAELLAPPPAGRAEPWRRTSGIHAIRNRRQLGVLRELWQARDAMAADRDVAPGRLLPDSAMIDAARRSPSDVEALLAMPVFRGPRQRRSAAAWMRAIDAGRAVPDDQLPTATAPAGDGPPPPARWKDRDPVAARRLTAVRDVVGQLAEQHTVLAQNLLAADLVRRIAWEPPPPDADGVAASLRDWGARAWQVELTAEPIAGALNAVPEEPETDSSAGEDSPAS